MKIINIIIIAALLSLSFIACDKIDAPYKEEIDIPVDTTSKYQKNVLLEDFTGHTCTNCPAAHELAHELTGIYGEERLIVVSIHAGWFANPSTAPFDYDFRTESGEDYASFFSVINYPIGLIDRKQDGGSYLFDVNKWGIEVDTSMKEETLLGINIEPNLQGDKLSGEINLEFITDFNQSSSLQIWIVEDSIIEAQKIPESQGGIIEDYVHNHVLRGAINGTWGEELPSATYSKGDKETISFANYQLGDDWVAKQLAIVAFVYDNESKRIVQVEKKKIIE